MGSNWVPYLIELRVNPVPASRPRVSSKGWAYFAGPYKAYRETVEEVIPGALQEAGLAEPLEGPLSVSLEFYCQKARTSKLDFPSGDIDNYQKAVLDALNKTAWLDDRQIVRVQAEKMWAAEDMEPMTIIVIEEYA